MAKDWCQVAIAMHDKQVQDLWHHAQDRIVTIRHFKTKYSFISSIHRPLTQAISYVRNRWRALSIIQMIQQSFLSNTHMTLWWMSVVSIIYAHCTQAEHRRSGGWSAANSGMPSYVIAKNSALMLSACIAVGTVACLSGVFQAGLCRLEIG